MSSELEHGEAAKALGEVRVPDLWQQQAVSALRAGQDVVVHAPTGAGKTMIFELWSKDGKNRHQAVYTVPTRALANDKLAEWRARGWNVGITTGDLSENVDAPIVVATLETQKSRLIRGEGPALLVIDEYQMLGDKDRGLNYELAIALAPSHTQLLMLSGSVANPQDIVKWLKRLGRNPVQVRHEIRPVPLEEVDANQLSYRLPSEIKGYWPRLVAKALADDLGPILIFAPRRSAAETMAAELARTLPVQNPLQLSPEQKMVAGDHLSKMLKSRVAYHHSGLSYAARAGLIEPLAKTGQLRVVVATMGLAAGINFSLRSVSLAGDSYKRDSVEHPIRPDEVLQMFGRAGRRGLDETGFVLVSANGVRLMDGRAAQLARTGAVDWGALFAVMAVAASAGKDPFTEAVRVQERLFTSKPVFLGMEQAIKFPDAPCRLPTDAERARLVRKRVRQLLNSKGEWEAWPATLDRPVAEIHCLTRLEDGTTRLVLMHSNQGAIEKIAHGELAKIGEENGLPVYGRTIQIAERLNGDRLLLTKQMRRVTNWNGKAVTQAQWDESVSKSVRANIVALKFDVVRFHTTDRHLLADVSVGRQVLRVPVDSHGVALWRPEDREVFPAPCTGCPQVAECQKLPTTTGTALLWRRLKLVDERGAPTRRGKMVSFFSHGDGLAVSAALEDEGYPVAELVYDMANLHAGFRFAKDDNRWAGRMAMACQERYGLQTIAGYLENGMPPEYNAGASPIVMEIHKNPLAKARWATPFLGEGDIDRMIIEWRSLLRQIAHSPTLEWSRWTQLQTLARSMLEETESPTNRVLPSLEYHQTKRVDHRLVLRRH